ncbi:MAG: hypothetical protein Q7R58_02875 [bacterium]|nr:hypothetical protein [bacterium]
MKILATFLVITLVVPSVFLTAPQRTRAQFTVEVVGDISFPSHVVTAEKTTFSAIKDGLNLISTYTNTAANVAQEINAYILQPLAFVLSGNLLKLITAVVLDFVIGETNGTGAPQFVQDLQGNLQIVGDIQANAFFIQFGRNSNSPFSGAITSSLRNNYLQNTSSAGFFAANRNTLAMYSSNPNAFLAGDWSQGGVGAWFALTTQNQNNPYTFYQTSQSHLASVVGGAISARLEELNWGQGFLSWCGAIEGNAVQEDDGFYNGEEFVSEGINPGDACRNKDGTWGTIKTPGTVIKAMLDNTLDSTRDKLVQMGALAKEVNNILADVATVMSTVNFAASLLGGSDSGGLFGVGQTSGTNSVSPLWQYQNSPGYLGVTQPTVLQNATNLTISGSEMLSRIAQYESAWNTLRSAANAASTTVASLESFCTAAASSTPNIASAATAQASAARTALTTEIAPVLSQVGAAEVVIANARAVVERIQNESLSTSGGAGAAYFASLQTIQTMPPTALDVSNVQQETETRIFNIAIAIPTGSLAVSGGSIIDRMRLLSTNATALKTTACNSFSFPFAPQNPGS